MHDEDDVFARREDAVKHVLDGEHVRVEVLEGWGGAPGREGYAVDGVVGFFQEAGGWGEGVGAMPWMG